MTNVIEMAAGLATIGKTEAQLEAERVAAELAAKRARWAAEVEKAGKADPNVCQARVYGSHDFRGHSCSLKARYHREERLNYYDSDAPVVVRHYCQQHDEVTKNEKRRAKNEIERKEREAKFAANDRARERERLVYAAVGHLNNAQLIELAAFLQTQEGFKKQ